MGAHPKVGDYSLWGPIEFVDPAGPDACWVATSSHGGFWVSPEAMERIPAEARETRYSRGGWFEEDCDWCIPYVVLGLGRYEGDPTDRKNHDETAQMMLKACHANIMDVVLGTVSIADTLESRKEPS